MTVGQLLTKVLLVPSVVAIFMHPIYLYTVEGVAFNEQYSILHMFTVTVSTILIIALFGIIGCYTVCNWNEDIRTWAKYENIKYYLKFGLSNSNKRKY